MNRKNLDGYIDPWTRMMVVRMGVLAEMTMSSCRCRWMHAEQ
jgi:hypothetical protein